MFFCGGHGLEFVAGFACPRFNERKLAELARAEGATEYRRRTGRMDKWRQLAKEAAGDHSGRQHQLKQIPDRIEQLGLIKNQMKTH